MNGVCKLCGTESQLVDSHVLPRALHLDMVAYAGNDEAMRIYSDKLDYQQRTQTGIYGQFVCTNCEALFHPWDECGIEWVRKYRDGDQGDALLGDRSRGFTTHTDYDKFKLWIMSLVWRANACEHTMFAWIQLGEKWTQALSVSLQNADPGDPEYFAVSASWFSEEVAKHYMADPIFERYDKINYVRFYVYGGFTIVIKVDQRDSAEAFKKFLLQEDGSLPVISRTLSPSERRAAANAFAAFTTQ